MSIILFVLLGQAVNVSPWYWVVLSIYALFKIFGIFIEVMKNFTDQR